MTQREIKFRGFHNGVWVYGDMIQTEHDFKRTYCILDWIDTPYQKIVAVESIGQFTGLKDKNGREIYEGDILNSPSGAKGLVEYGLGRFGVNWDYGTNNQTMVGAWGQEDNLRGLEDGYYRDLEVIGNVYEHKHLIE